MKGTEFRQLRLELKLSYRRCAATFRTSTNSIRLWETGRRIPSEVADKLRVLAERQRLDARIEQLDQTVADAEGKPHG